MLIARGVLRRDVSHDVVDVAVEELWSQLFGEVVGHVEGGVDTFQFDEVAFDPFTNDVEFDVDMACAGCGFL